MYVHIMLLDKVSQIGNGKRKYKYLSVSFVLASGVRNTVQSRFVTDISFHNSQMYYDMKVKDGIRSVSVVKEEQSVHRKPN